MRKELLTPYGLRTLARNNHGYVAPSLDLVFVRVGDGNKYPMNFEKELVKKVLAAVGR